MTLISMAVGKYQITSFLCKGSINYTYTYIILKEYSIQSGMYTENKMLYLRHLLWYNSLISVRIRSIKIK